MPTIGNVVRYDQRRIIRLESIPGNHDGPMVLVHKKVLYDIYHHADNELHHEVGGYLIGFPAIDHRTGKKVTYVDKAIRAIYDSSKTHVTMHSISFNEVENIRQRDGTILVGWYHSHPNMGIFLSGTDTENFRIYHPEQYQVAVVVDPSKTEKNIESDSEWIGFWGWNSRGEIVRVPEKNIHYVDIRPEAEPFVAPVPHLLDQVETAIAAVEHASNVLKGNQNVINAYFPIVVLAEKFETSLLRIPQSLPQEGFIFGEIDYIAGYKLIFVNSILPYELSRIQEYQRSIGELWRRYSQYPDKNKYPELKPYLDGFYPIGIYLSEPRLKQVSYKSRLFRRHLTYKAFTKYLGNDYFVITTESVGGKRAFSLSIWSSSVHELEKIPPSQIVVKSV